jgi:hypothetical protein
MMTVEENNFPHGIEQFNFNQKFRFEGSKKTYQRPHRNIILKARNLQILERVDAGDGPFNSQVGSLWGKKAPTQETKSTQWLSAVADLEDDFQIIGDSRPKEKFINIDLSFTEDDGTESEHFEGLLKFHGYSVDDFNWHLTLNCPSNMAKDLVEQVQNGIISTLEFRVSIRDGFIDYESHNHVKTETWWFPRNEDNVWSAVFLNSLTWTSKAQLVAMPNTYSLEYDFGAPVQQSAPAQAIPLSQDTQNQKPPYIRSIIYALWVIAIILFIQLIWQMKSTNV